jgi:CHAT domain-containing protein
VQPAEHRKHARVLASALLRRALAPESAGLARGTALDRAWVAISSALQAARNLALREALVSFRQREWAENARVFTLAAAITALRGDMEHPAEQPAEQRSQLAQAIALLEEGRARGLAEAAGRRNADIAQLSAPERLRYRQAVETVQDVEAQSRQSGDPLALQAEAQGADARLKEVVRDLRSRYPGFLPEPDVSLPALTGELGAGEALVYLMPLEAGTLTLAIGPSGEPVMRWLGKLTSDVIFALAVQPNEDGAHRYGYLPAALGWGETPLDVALDTLLPALGDDLMRVVTQIVRQLGCHRATLVAGGFLSVMPLHAATYPPLAGEPSTAPSGRRYACDDVAITYAPSGLTLLAARATAHRQAQAGPATQALAVGNPQLTRQSEPWAPGVNYYLPFAELEAHRVAALAAERTPTFQVNLKTNDTATWIAVRDGLRAADLAHLSLHARFDSDEPDKSALLVAFRSHLYLRDLLDTRSGALDRLRLIVLSACQSGLSDVQRQSEESVGLFGALLAAGAPAVIGTLWSVNDLATARFMESFARRAYRDGVAPDAALRAAARELRGVGEAVAAPAETGASASEEWSAEEVVPEQPHATPAREAIAHDLRSLDADLVSATREMSLPEWQAATAALADYRRRLIERRGVEHPMYWAAFVYYGASVSLASDDATPKSVVGATTRGGFNMASDDPRDDDQSDQSGKDEDEALLFGEERTAGYYPTSNPSLGEICPRCTGVDYRLVSGAPGLRECLSCGKKYGPNSARGGNI